MELVTCIDRLLHRFQDKFSINFTADNQLFDKDKDNSELFFIQIFMNIYY